MDDCHTVTLPPFKNESLSRVNRYIPVARMSYKLNRWIGVRIDVMGANFTTALASYLVYGPSVGADFLPSTDAV